MRLDQAAVDQAEDHLFRPLPDTLFQRRTRQ
jgi:hypothetical protein